jgi:hypothetical protein
MIFEWNFWTLFNWTLQVARENGVLIYKDEATFKVHGTTAKTWQEKGRNNGREVKQKSGRESVKAFEAVTIEKNPGFQFRIVEVFNAVKFLAFLMQLVRQYDRKIFMVLDNVHYHHAVLHNKPHVESTLAWGLLYPFQKWRNKCRTQFVNGYGLPPQTFHDGLL